MPHGGYGSLPAFLVTSRARDRGRSVKRATAMGISELLPLLKPALKEVRLSEFRGKRVGVDGNVWIFRGAYSCALDLHLNVHTSSYIGYCCSLARMLLENGIHPVVVFDGYSLAAKDGTSHKRAEQRREATAELELQMENWRELQMRHEAQPHNNQLQHEVGAARARTEHAAQRTIKVTAQMVERVMSALRGLGVDVMRAPYEADAQLAYLAKRRSVAAVLTEDSDLVAHACPCVLLKLDRHAGTVQRLLWEDVPTVSAGNGLSLKNFDQTMFLELCILVGCDYLESPKRLGLKTAIKLMAKFGEARRVIRHLRQNKPNGVSVAADYADKFANALITFRHARVWSPQLRKLVHLSEPIPADFSGDVDLCCGADMEPAEAGRWVHAGAPVPASDPFSKAVQMPAAAASASGASSLPNPFQVGRRSSPSRRGRTTQRRAGGSPARPGMAEEAEGLLDAPNSASKYEKKQRFEQFEDDDSEDGGREELVLRSAARPLFDPAYAQPPPAVPQDLRDSDEPPLSGVQEAAATGGGGFEEDEWAEAWNEGANHEASDDFHEPSVEELISYASSQQAPPPPAASPPGVKGVRLSEALYNRAAVAAPPPASGPAADGGPVNPFAGKRRRSEWAEKGHMPPGTGVIDALHPYGSSATAPASGRGASKRARTSGGFGGSSGGGSSAADARAAQADEEPVLSASRSATRRAAARAALEAEEQASRNVSSSASKRLRDAAAAQRRPADFASSAEPAAPRGAPPRTASASTAGKKHSAKVPKSTVKTAKTKAVAKSAPSKLDGTVGIASFFSRSAA